MPESESEPIMPNDGKKGVSHGAVVYRDHSPEMGGVPAKLKNIGRILLSKTAAPSQTELYTRAG